MIAYILLCHKDPAGIIAQAERLTAAGDCLSIHFDGRSKARDYAKIREALKDNQRVTFTPKRHKCGWGEWSLVAATIAALQAAVDSFPRATHFYMLSGDCMPIKTAEYMRRFLAAHDVDYIESFDYFRSDWIKTGIKDERLIYRHWFNERNRKTLFYASMELQKRLGLSRKVPSDLAMQIGSQWWCLRRHTAESLLAFVKARKDVLRFFRTTWIPDETFFQTLVRHLVPDAEIVTRTLTFLLFTDYGMPVTFYNDHYDLLLSQDYLFARKISPDAQLLKERLGRLYTQSGQDFDISGEGRRMFRFLAGRGRIGRRFAPRFWEREASLGRERRLLMVTCKKWHIAKRLVDQAQKVTGIPALHYIFDEDSAEMPDLGGIQSTLEKRTRHRRALLRMLYDFEQSDQLIFCIDPASVDLMQDFYQDKADVRLLEINCDFTEEYLVGHAKRVGLASDATPLATLQRLMPTIRYDVEFERQRIRDHGFPHLYRIEESAELAVNAHSLAAFFGIAEAKAREIAQTPYLFDS